MPEPRAKFTFEADATDLNRTLGNVEQKFGSVDRSSAQLSTSLNQLVGVFVSLKTAQQALASIRLGEQFEQARGAFKRWVSDADAALAQMRAATKGTVDDLTLIQRANEALNKGVTFDQFVTALEYADMVADTTGQNFETILTRVTTALGRAEAGAIQKKAALVALGITSTDTTGILEQMRAKVAELNTGYNSGDEAMARFDASMKNLQTTTGTLLKEAFLPLIESLNVMASYAAGGAVESIIDAANNLSTSSFWSVILGDEKLHNMGWQTSQIVDDLTRKMASGRDKVEDFNGAVAALSAHLDDITDPEILENMKNLIAVIEDTAKVRFKPIATTGPDTPPFADPEKTPDGAPRPDSPEEIARRRREALQIERDFVKTKIQLEQATYADLAALLDQQEADNRVFFDSDKQARLDLLKDRALVYQQDQKNQENSEAEKYNATRRFIGYTLEDETRAKDQRIRDAVEIIDYTLAHENLSIEQRRVLLDQRKDLERQFTAFVLEQHQEQIQFLQQMFGTTALQIVDDFFSGVERRFEDYLKNILRMLARYALSTLLGRLFGSLGGLFGGGGIAPLPGSPTDFFGTTSVPRVPDLTGGIPIPGLSGFNSGSRAGAASPTFSPTFAPVIQPNITLLLTDEGLAARVDRGNHIRNKSKLSA